MYDPQLDGIEHINAYSRGRTLLGRTLSNFAHTPFVLPEDGRFASIEGYWYWLGSGNDKLRALHGWSAKRVGQRAEQTIRLPDFEARVKRALIYKFAHNPKIANLFKSTPPLPVVHYYLSSVGKVFIPERHGWVWEYWTFIWGRYLEKIREEEKSGEAGNGIKS